MPKDNKLLTWVNVLKLVGGAVSLIAIYFLAEMAQNKQIADQNTRIEKTLTVVDEHVAASTKTFAELNITMREQRAHNIEVRREQRAFNIGTVKSMERISTTQEQLKKENGRLAEHAEESTKALTRVTVIQEQLIQSVEELKRAP